MVSPAVAFISGVFFTGVVLGLLLLARAAATGGDHWAVVAGVLGLLLLVVIFVVAVFLSQLRVWPS